MWLMLLVQVSIIYLTSSVITMNNVVVRVPKPGDIGIIFDLNVVNTANEKKEVLEYNIRPDKSCCIKLTETCSMCEAGKILGGHFGSIGAGDMDTISVIWPTVSLYNRVGNCSIIITSINLRREKVEIKQTLSFDTRFSTLDPNHDTLTKDKKFHDCRNWDLDYMNNCQPVNCEERYFGKRSFYNCAKKICEPATACNDTCESYDMFSNECIDGKNFITDADIEQLKKGNFQKDLSLTRYSRENNLKPASSVKNIHEQDESIEKVRSVDESTPTYRKFLYGLTIVVATLAVYIFACFIIFLIVSWVTRRKSKSRESVVIREQVGITYHHSDDESIHSLH